MPRTSEATRDEFREMVAEFGQDRACRWFAEGLTLAQAKERHVAELTASNRELCAVVEEVEGRPVASKTGAGS